MDDKWKCIRCGYSCTLRVKINAFEWLRIFLQGKRNFSEIGFNKKLQLKHTNGHCILLKKKDGKPYCSVYNNRPKMCRNYPGLEFGRCNKPKLDLRSVEDVK